MLNKRTKESCWIYLTFDEAIDDSVDPETKKPRADLERYFVSNDEKHAPLKPGETPSRFEIARLSGVAWDHIRTTPEGLKEREALRFGLRGVRDFQHEGQPLALKFKSYALPGGNATGLTDESLNAFRDCPPILNELGRRIALMSTLADPANPT